MKLVKVALAAAALSIAGAANAATVVYTSNEVPLQGVDFADILQLQKFDPSLGHLTGIVLSLTGNLAGSAQAENLGGVASNITLQLNATLTLQRPDATTLVITNPIINNTFTASAFDGSIDFGGTSGVTYSDLDITAVNSVTLDSADFALFTGTGLLDGPLLAQGHSIATGGGSIVSAFNTQAGAFATVTYTYDAAPSVPEPATWALMIVGIGMVGVSARRRRGANVVTA